jgi:hypothetical protein
MHSGATGTATSWPRRPTSARTGLDGGPTFTYGPSAYAMRQYESGGAHGSSGHGERPLATVMRPFRPPKAIAPLASRYKSIQCLPQSQLQRRLEGKVAEEGWYPVCLVPPSLQFGTPLFSLYSRFLYPFFSSPPPPPKRLLAFSNGAMAGFLLHPQGRLEAGGGGLPPPQRRPESAGFDCSR